VPHQTFEPESGVDPGHLDAERLMAAALGEDGIDAAEEGHLLTCPACRHERDALTTVAGLVRSAPGLASLPMPPPGVWDRIALDIGGVGKASTPAPHPERARGEQRRKVWWQRVALAAAAALIGVVGTIGVGQIVSRTNQPVVTVQADLSAFGTTPPAAHGIARVLSEDGATALHIHVADLPSTEGFYEVWLINPDTGQMISVGVLGGQQDVVLPLAEAIDLTEYRLVDVSAEPLDGDPAHSGDSLLRGTWTV
jgi:anti-sigma-K factor RskA